MSRWPVPDGPPDFTSGNAALREQFPLVPQGISADLIATIEGFTRDEVDAFAVRSQALAAKAMAEGAFDKSVMPIKNPNGSIALAVDEFPRPGSTLEAMANLRASFETMGTQVFDGYDRSFDDMCKQVYPHVDAVNHVHHAGNSSGVVDGGSAVLLASPEYAKAHGLKPRARIVMSAVAGAEPVIMLTAPGPASRKCLEDRKIWTTSAHEHDWIIVLCRTTRRDDVDDKRQGLSQLIVDLKAPGVQATPIPFIDGTADFCEVVFDNVFVPDDLVLGEIGQGWTQNTSELAYERGGPDRWLSSYLLLEELLRDETAAGPDNLFAFVAD